MLYSKIQVKERKEKQKSKKRNVRANSNISHISVSCPIKRPRADAHPS
jgi:hypothetical protein